MGIDVEHVELVSKSLGWKLRVVQELEETRESHRYIKGGINVHPLDREE